ncbi:MAG: histidine phosphatase family protein [Chloroflexota bacterium]|jgi:broad specificity phosphatase PhoE
MGSGFTKLFLVRHAETEWNAGHIFQGHLDSTLTPRGLAQATALASRLASEGIQVIYSSDQGRSMRTAEPLATKLELQVIPRSDLREIDCGEWTGKSYEEVHELWPEEHHNWRFRPDLHRMPGGESVLQVQQRGLRFLEEIRLRHPGQTICAVTHNTVVRAIITHLQRRPLSKIWDGDRQPNCAVNLIELKNSRSELLIVGDTAHLEDVGSSGMLIV